MLRNDLKTNTLYFDGVREQYFYTPNPPGVVWLTPMEADLMFYENETVYIDKLEDW